MYTRNYIDDGGGMNIPQNYDGIAFDTDIPDTKNTIAASMGEKKISPPDMKAEAPESAPTSANAEGSGIFGGFLQKLGLKNILPSSIGSLFQLDQFKLGKEEILLIGIALFLLFSKEGDKECAIILLLLLFVN